jgi:hypothetical protein
MLGWVGFGVGLVWLEVEEETEMKQRRRRGSNNKQPPSHLVL